MRDIIESIFIGLGLAILVIITVTGSVMGLAYFNCKDIANTTGRETKFTIMGGCYVKVNNKLIPYDKWTLININEGDK